MKIRAFLLATTLSVVCFGDATAQTSIDSRVAKLEEAVRLLERRLAALERQPQAASSARVAPAKVNWRKLRNGMAESEVEQLLGSPSKVDVNEYFITWYYGYPSGGRVQFDAEQRIVEGWTEP